MNSYEKQKAQLERKKVFKKYETWVFPQSDLGVEVLSEEGFFTEYPFYYNDEKETEQNRLKEVKDATEFALAYQFEQFSHRNVSIETYRFKINQPTLGFAPRLIQGIDYDIQITEIPVEEVHEMTYDDIQAL